VSDLDVLEWEHVQSLGGQLEFSGVPFSVTFVALILDNLEVDFASLAVGVDFGSVGGLDHDVTSLVTGVVAVGVLVLAVVGNGLFHDHAVDTHVTEGNLVGNV